MSNETNETPVQGRKVGIARFFELLGRDLWPLYKSGILCVLGFLPGTALAVFGMMAGSALLTVVGGVVGGLVGGPFLSGMIDTVLRALRDEPGYWWNTYKRAWKQNWRQSLVPGALLGLFVGSWAWMLRAQAESGNTSTALWVASFAGIFVCTGFFTWLLAQVPLVDLPLVQIAKNAGLMFFGFFPRTAAAALVLALYWGATLLYLPATILTILAFGFWLPVTIALMIVYPGLEKVFKLEEGHRQAQHRLPRRQQAGEHHADRGRQGDRRQDRHVEARQVRRHRRHDHHARRGGVPRRIRQAAARQGRPQGRDDVLRHRRQLLRLGLAEVVLSHCRPSLAPSSSPFPLNHPISLNGLTADFTGEIGCKSVKRKTSCITKKLTHDRNHLHDRTHDRIARR